MKKHKLLNYVLLIFLVLTFNFSFGQDKTWLVTTETYKDENLNRKAQKVDLNCNFWPLDIVAENAKKGYFIEKIAFTNYGWTILSTKKITRQEIKVVDKFDEKFYSDAKKRGLSLIEFSIGQYLDYVMVMSDIGDASKFSYISSFSWEDVLEKAEEQGVSVFRMFPVSTGWIGLTEKNSQISNVTSKVSYEFPYKWVDDNMRNGLFIIDAHFTEKEWYVLMGNSSKIAKQEYYVTEGFQPARYENANQKIGFMHYSYDYETSYENAKKYGDLGRKAYDQKNFELAIIHYTNSLNILGSQESLLYSRALCKYKLKQYEGAIQDYNLILRHDKNNKDALSSRGDCYFELGKFKEAIDDYTLWIKLEKDSESKILYYSSRADCYIELGEYDKALKDLKIVIKAKPSDFYIANQIKDIESKITVSDPVITWDKPFYASTSVDKSSYKVSACINGKKSDLTKIDLFLNGKLVNDTRGFSVEEACVESLSQNITLVPGNNILEIVIKTPNGDVRSETRQINYNVNRSKNNYHALLIACENYEDPAISKLNNPVKDANELKKILISNYTFENEDVHVLKNPTKAEIRNKFAELATSLTEKDNIVIFYAGHGAVDSVRNETFRTYDVSGYWLPVDAKMKDKSTWLDNQLLFDLIHNLKTKHTLVVADACFSGSLLNIRSRSLNSNTNSKGSSYSNMSTAKLSESEIFAITCDKLMEFGSCKVMTSGNLTEVPDKSLFMASFLNAIEANKESCLPVDDLFSDINKIMRRKQLGQESKYESFQTKKHQQGEFVFKKR